MFFPSYTQCTFLFNNKLICEYITCSHLKSPFATIPGPGSVSLLFTFKLDWTIGIITYTIKEASDNKPCCYKGALIWARHFWNTIYYTSTSTAHSIVPFCLGFNCQVPSLGDLLYAWLTCQIMLMLVNWLYQPPYACHSLPLPRK